MMVLYTADLIKSINESNKDGGAQWLFLPQTLSKFTLSQIIFLAFGSNMDLDWMHERQVRIGELFVPHMLSYILFGPLVQYIPGTKSWYVILIRSLGPAKLGREFRMFQGQTFLTLIRDFFPGFS